MLQVVDSALSYFVTQTENVQVADSALSYDMT